MANTEDLIINLKAVMDTSDIKNNLNAVQTTLSKLKLPSTLKTSLSSTFNEAYKSINKVEDKLSQGFKTKGDTSSFIKSVNEMESCLNEVNRQIQQISSEDLRLNIDSKELDDLKSRLQEITKEMDASKSTKEFQELSNAINNVSKVSKTSAIKELKKSLDTMDFKNVKQNVNDLVQSLTNFDRKNQLSVQTARALINCWDGAKFDTAKFTEAGFSLDNLAQGAKQLYALLPVLATAIDKAGSHFDKWEQGRVQADKLTTEVEELVQEITDGLSTGMDDLKDKFEKSTVEANNFGEAQKDIAKETQKATQEFDQLKSRLTYFTSLVNGAQLFKRAIREAYEEIKALDEAMTETAVVTDFSVGDMWSKLPEYTDIANKYGSSIQDAYEVMTIFYQQGLETNQVFEIGTETMQMARIAGLDYADAADKMTNALRGFNMELTSTSAQNVNDVYSKLAAISASDTKELATAMTKVASLANSANMEFENTAAFLAQMIETTRESAETAGTALKTVVARFAEVKELYSEGELIGDVEGEEININKVGEALRAAGIDLNKFMVGQKGLDDILLELAEKWDNLDLLTQRYIATMAAGSRQQSRFLALMSDNARLTDLVSAAYNAEGASAEQFAKTQESLETKLNKLKNAWDEFIMGLSNASLVKALIGMLTGLLSAINNVLDGFDKLGAVGSFGKTIASLGIVITAFLTLKTVINNVIRKIQIMQAAFNGTQAPAQSFVGIMGGLANIISRIKLAKAGEITFTPILDKGRFLDEFKSLRQAMSKEASTEDLINIANKTKGAAAKDIESKNDNKELAKNTVLQEANNEAKEEGAEASLKNGTAKKAETDLIEDNSKALAENTIAENLDVDSIEDATKSKKSIKEKFKDSSFGQGWEEGRAPIKNKKGAFEDYKKALNNPEGQKLLKDNLDDAQKAFDNNQNNIQKYTEAINNGDFKGLGLKGSKRAQKHNAQNRLKKWQSETADKQGALDSAKEAYNNGSLESLKQKALDAGNSEKSLDALSKKGIDLKKTLGNVGNKGKEAFSKVGQKIGSAAKAMGKFLALNLHTIAVVGGVVAAVAAVAIAAYAIYKHTKAAEEAAKAKQAQEEAEKLCKVYEKTKERVDSLTSAWEKFNSVNDKLDNLVEGTTEWTAALMEANTAVLELLENAPELADALTINENGVMSIDQSSYNKILSSKQKAQYDAQLAYLSQKAASNYRNTMLKSNKAYRAADTKGINLSSTSGGEDRIIREAFQKYLSENEESSNATTVDQMANNVKFASWLKDKDSYASKILAAKRSNMQTQITALTAYQSQLKAYSQQYLLNNGYNNQVSSAAANLASNDPETNRKLQMQSYIDLRGGTNDAKNDAHDIWEDNQRYATGQSEFASLVDQLAAQGMDVSYTNKGNKLKFNGEEIEVAFNRFEDRKSKENVQSVDSLIRQLMETYQSSGQLKKRAAVLSKKGNEDLIKAINGDLTINEENATASYKGLSDTDKQALGFVDTKKEDGTKSTGQDKFNNYLAKVRLKKTQTVQSINERGGLTIEEEDLTPEKLEKVQNALDMQNKMASALGEGASQVLVDISLGLDEVGTIKDDGLKQTVNSLTKAGVSAEDLQKSAEKIDFSNPVLGAKQLNNMLKEGGKNAAIAKTYLTTDENSGEGFFGVTNQLRTALNEKVSNSTLIDQLKGIAQAEEEISADNIEELAEKYSYLNIMLKENEIGQTALAKIMTSVANEEINLTDITDDLANALSKMTASADLAANAMKTLKSYEIGEDLTDIGETFTQDSKAVSDFIKRGAVNNTQIDDYMKQMLGETTWEAILSMEDINGDTSKAVKYANKNYALDKNEGNTLQTWKKMVGGLNENDPLSEIFQSDGKDGFTANFKGQNTKDIIQQMADKWFFGDTAQAGVYLQDLITYTPGAKQALETGDYQSGMKDFIGKKLTADAKGNYKISATQAEWQNMQANDKEYEKNGTVTSDDKTYKKDADGNWVTIDDNTKVEDETKIAELNNKFDSTQNYADWVANKAKITKDSKEKTLSTEISYAQGLVTKDKDGKATLAGDAAILNESGTVTVGEKNYRDAVNEIKSKSFDDYASKNEDLEKEEEEAFNEQKANDLADLKESRIKDIASQIATINADKTLTQREKDEATAKLKSSGAAVEGLDEESQISPEEITAAIGDANSENMLSGDEMATSVYNGVVNAFATLVGQGLFAEDLGETERDEFKINVTNAAQTMINASTKTDEDGNVTSDTDATENEGVTVEFNTDESGRKTTGNLPTFPKGNDPTNTGDSGGGGGGGSGETEEDKALKALQEGGVWTSLAQLKVLEKKKQLLYKEYGIEQKTFEERLKELSLVKDANVKWTDFFKSIEDGTFSFKDGFSSLKDSLSSLKDINFSDLANLPQKISDFLAGDKLTGTKDIDDDFYYDLDEINDQIFDVIAAMIDEGVTRTNNVINNVGKVAQSAIKMISTLASTAVEGFKSYLNHLTISIDDSHDIEQLEESLSNIVDRLDWEYQKMIKKKIGYNGLDALNEKELFKNSDESARNLIVRVQNQRRLYENSFRQLEDLGININSELTEAFEKLYDQLYGANGPFTRLNKSINNFKGKLYDVFPSTSKVFGEVKDVIGNLFSKGQSQIDDLLTNLFPTSIFEDIIGNFSIDNYQLGDYGKSSMQKLIQVFTELTPSFNADYQIANKAELVDALTQKMGTILTNDTITSKFVSGYLEYLTNIEKQMESEVDNIRKSEKQILDLYDNLTEIIQRGKEEYSSLGQAIYQGIVDGKNSLLEELNALNQSITESDSEIIETLKKNLEVIRQERENDKTEDDLKAKEAKLAYLKQDTTGANLQEIRKLEKELEEGQESYTDKLIDQKISELEEQNQGAADQRQVQIDLLQAEIDNTKGIWDTVEKLLAGISKFDKYLSGEIDREGYSAVITELKKTQSYIDGSSLDRQANEEEWDSMIRAASLYKQVKDNLGEEYKYLKLATNLIDLKTGLPEEFAANEGWHNYVSFSTLENTVDRSNGLLIEAIAAINNLVDKITVSYDDEQSLHMKMTYYGGLIQAVSGTESAASKAIEDIASEAPGILTQLTEGTGNFAKGFMKMVGATADSGLSLVEFAKTFIPQILGSGMPGGVGATALGNIGEGIGYIVEGMSNFGAALADAASMGMGIAGDMAPGIVDIGVAVATALKETFFNDYVKVNDELEENIDAIINNLGNTLGTSGYLKEIRDAIILAEKTKMGQPGEVNEPIYDALTEVYQDILSDYRNLMKKDPDKNDVEGFNKLYVRTLKLRETLTGLNNFEPEVGEGEALELDPGETLEIIQKWRGEIGSLFQQIEESSKDTILSIVNGILGSEGKTLGDKKISRWIDIYDSILMSQPTTSTIQKLAVAMEEFESELSNKLYKLFDAQTEQENTPQESFVSFWNHKVAGIWGDVNDFFSNFWEKLKDAFKGASEKIFGFTYKGSWLEDIITKIKGWFDDIKEKGLWGLINSSFESFTANLENSALAKIIIDIANFIENITQAVSTIVSRIQKLPLGSHLTQEQAAELNTAAKAKLGYNPLFSQITLTNKVAETIEFANPVKNKKNRQRVLEFINALSDEIQQDLSEEIAELKTYYDPEKPQGLSTSLNSYAIGGTIPYNQTALVGEAGTELIQHANGGATLATSPSMANLQKGDVVYNAKQTKQILNGDGLNFNRFAEGTVGNMMMRNVLPLGVTSLSFDIPNSTENNKESVFNLNLNLEDLTVDSIDRVEQVADKVMEKITNTVSGAIWPYNRL